MTTTSAYAGGLANEFTEEDNDLLTRVGPGTLMGNLFRQYWIPVLPVSHLEEPGGRPLRVKLLGEDLVAFRTLDGEVGLIGSYCSHRLAPLFFGRIENDGLRCPYHGWKYAPSGKCLDMPNVPPEHQFKDRIKHPGYPIAEYGGIIWTYMGPSNELPTLPQFEFTMVPEDQRRIRLFYQDCNYLQALEGGIDPTHIMWLHSPYDLSDDDIAKSNQPLQHRLAHTTKTRTPLAIEIVDTEIGFMYGAKRPMGDGKNLWRVNQFLLPFYTMPPGGDTRSSRVWFPIDDETCVKWMINWFPTRSIMDSTKEKRRDFAGESYLAPTSEPYGHVRPKAMKSNNYLIDWEVQKTRRLGIAGVNLQDKCVQENEGPTPILDRTQENLCVGDMTIIKARRKLLQAARALREKSTVPPGVRDPSVYRVRATSTIVENNINWVEGVKKDITVATNTS